MEPYIDSTKRVCFGIASGDTRQEARENLKRILREINIKTN